MVCLSSLDGAEGKGGTRLKHLGFYVLSLAIDDNGDVGNFELEDSNIYQDDTAILHDGDKKYLDLYYCYNPEGWVNDGGIKWRVLDSSTINKFQEFWENREVMWLEDKEDAALTTLVKLRTPQGNQLEKDDIIDEIIQGFKSINWDIFNTSGYMIDYDNVVENELSAQVDKIIQDMKYKDGTVLQEVENSAKKEK